MSSPAPTSTARAAGRSAPGRRVGARPRRTARADGLDRLRILLAGAMGAVLAGYALLVPVAAALLASGGGGSLDAAFAVAVPMWLAAQRIPVVIGGQPLGVLPLLPTVVVVVVIALASSRSARRLGGRLRHDAGAVVASQAGAGAAVAVLAGALLPADVAVTTPWSSMVSAGLLAACASGLGVLRGCRWPRAWSVRLDGWPRTALAGVRAGLLGLLVAGGLGLLTTLLVHVGDVTGSFARLAPDAGAGAGVCLLALGYLPNALVGAVAWMLGPGVGVGLARSAPFDAVPGPLPPFPLFAAVPADPPSAWAPLVLLLPLAVGALVGTVCRRVAGPSAPLRDRLVAAGSATGAVAVVTGLAAALAGGRLPDGPYDPVSLSPVSVTLAALVLLGVPATVACAAVDEILGRSRGSLAGRDGRRRPAGPVRRPGEGPRPGGGPRPAGRRPAANGRSDRPDRPIPRTVGELVADRGLDEDHDPGPDDARRENHPGRGGSVGGPASDATPDSDLDAGHADAGDAADPGRDADAGHPDAPGGDGPRSDAASTHQTDR